MLSLSLTVAISNCNALSRFGRSICRWRGFLTGMRSQDCTLLPSTYLHGRRGCTYGNSPSNSRLHQLPVSARCSAVVKR